MHMCYSTSRWRIGPINASLLRYLMKAIYPILVYTMNKPHPCVRKCRAMLGNLHNSA